MSCCVSLVQAWPICVVRCLPIKRGMGAGVVESHPALADASDLEAVSDFFEIDRLLLQAAPESFDDDVVEVSPARSCRPAALPPPPWPFTDLQNSGALPFSYPLEGSGYTLADCPVFWDLFSRRLQLPKRQVRSESVFSRHYLSPDLVLWISQVGLANCGHGHPESLERDEEKDRAERDHDHHVGPDDIQSGIAIENGLRKRHEMCRR